VDHTSAQNGGVRLDSDAFTDVRLWAGYSLISTVGGF
jgi:hypothetical protein